MVVEATGLMSRKKGSSRRKGMGSPLAWPRLMASGRATADTAPIFTVLGSGERAIYVSRHLATCTSKPFRAPVPTPFSSASCPQLIVSLSSPCPSPTPFSCNPFPSTPQGRWPRGPVFSCAHPSSLGHGSVDFMPPRLQVLSCSAASAPDASTCSARAAAADHGECTQENSDRNGVRC